MCLVPPLNHEEVYQKMTQENEFRRPLDMPNLFSTSNLPNILQGRKASIERMLRTWIGITRQSRQSSGEGEEEDGT